MVSAAASSQEVRPTAGQRAKTKKGNLPTRKLVAFPGKKQPRSKSKIVSRPAGGKDQARKGRVRQARALDDAKKIDDAFLDGQTEARLAFFSFFCSATISRPLVFALFPPLD